jgi:hypothetical protein
MEQKLEVDFEKWLRSYDISLSFQNIKKIIVRGSWSRNHKIFIAKPAKGGGAYVYFLDIVLERDVRNQAGIAIFWILGKNAEKFSIPSPEGNNAVRDTQI